MACYQCLNCRSTSGCSKGALDDPEQAQPLTVSVLTRYMRRRLQKQSHPQRPFSHVVADRAVVPLRNSVPAQWIVREIPQDYGIDCEIEVVSEDGAVSGAIVKAQVKGTSRKAFYVRVPVQQVRYWLDLPVPVVLILVVRERVRWIDVRDYLLEGDRLDHIYLTAQKTIGFNFRNASGLPEDSEYFRQLAFEHQESVNAGREAEVDRLPGDFMGFHLLVKLFDNDPDKWIQALRDRGSDEQLENDLPFVFWGKSEAHRDPGFFMWVKAKVKSTSAY